MFSYRRYQLWNCFPAGLVAETQRVHTDAWWKFTDNQWEQHNGQSSFWKCSRKAWFYYQEHQQPESMKGCGHRFSCLGGTLQKGILVIIRSDWMGWKRWWVQEWSDNRVQAHGTPEKKLADHGCIFMKTADVIELPEQTEQKIFFKVTQAYKYFIKNSYIMLDTLNMYQVQRWFRLLRHGCDTTGWTGRWQQPDQDAICRQLCGQWHKGKTGRFAGLGLNQQKIGWLYSTTLPQNLKQCRKNLLI